jgi:hypothetical protein
MAAIALSVFSASCGSKEKKKDEPIAVGPAAGAAAAPASAGLELPTGIGVARGLDPSLAPSSTQWTRVVVLDERRAVLAGQAGDEVVILRTSDAGRTWRSLRGQASAWWSLAVGADGSLVFASGDRERPRAALAPGQKARVDAVRLSFADAEAATFGPTSEIVPAAGTKGAPRVPQGSAALPAPLSPVAAALLVEQGPRKLALAYGAPAGIEPSAPALFPATERVASTPYGRPPSFLSLAGKTLASRLAPDPGAALADPAPIAGLPASPALLTELAELPACDAGPWSFQRVTAAGKRALLGVSPGKAVVVALPPTTLRATPVGCSAERVTVLALAPKETIESVVACPLEGACVTPENKPFRAWDGPHQRTILAVPTARGVVAAMDVRTSDRWGLYVAPSLDGGKLYEVARDAGEGKGDRGRLELGALVSFGGRVVLLVRGDVAGTSRRGLYALASEDGGSTWGPP